MNMASVTVRRVCRVCNISHSTHSTRNMRSMDSMDSRRNMRRMHTIRSTGRTGRMGSVRNTCNTRNMDSILSMCHMHTMHSTHSRSCTQEGQTTGVCHSMPPRHTCIPLPFSTLPPRTVGTGRGAGMGGDKDMGLQGLQGLQRAHTEARPVRPARPLLLARLGVRVARTQVAPIATPMHDTYARHLCTMPASL